MKRVLVFHGHTESAHTFGRKLKDVREALQNDIEFVFVDAPHLLAPTASTPRCWYHNLQDGSDSVAAAKSLKYVREILERDGPFQGVMGLGEGGTFATLVSGLLESPNHTPHFMGINHPPLEFLVLFSCCKTINPGFTAPQDMKTPTLLVIGSNDTLVVPEHSYELAGFFNKDNVRVEVHNGGHWVPRKPEWRQFLISYFKAWANYPGSQDESPLLTPFASTSANVQPYAFYVNAADADGFSKSSKQVAATKNRRYSWTEVVPKTFWEGGVDPGELAQSLLNIDEGEEDEEESAESALEPVHWNEAFEISKPVAEFRSANKGIGQGKVHFFEDAPEPLSEALRARKLSGMEESPVSITIVDSSGSSTPTSDSEPSTPPYDPTTRLSKRFFGSTAERRLRACKNAGLPRRLSQDPEYILVRVTGGREILVQRGELETPAVDYGMEKD